MFLFQVISLVFTVVQVGYQIIFVTQHILNTTSPLHQSYRLPKVLQVGYDNFNNRHIKFVGAVSTDNEPRLFKDVIKHVRWRKAMREEINALENNDTWEIIDLPPGKKAIGCQWVYKIKIKSDGEFERDKARLVVLGKKVKIIFTHSLRLEKWSMCVHLLQLL